MNCLQFLACPRLLHQSNFPEHIRKLINQESSRGIGGPPLYILIIAESVRNRRTLLPKNRNVTVRRPCPHALLWLFETGCQKLSKYRQGQTTTNSPSTPAAWPPALVKRPIQSAAVEKGSQGCSLAGGTLWVQFGVDFNIPL